MRRSNVVYMDQIDAATYSVNEEITLLRWGNVKITSIEKSPEGAVVSMHGTYDPDATNFSKTKKATWLAKSDDVLPAIFMDYDHLISKAKLADEENFQDFINPNSKSEARGLVDPCLRSVSKGQVIQLERKGFYICDKPYGGPEDPIVLIYIPDGKAKPAFSSAPKK